jgi:voltage-gated potassium channel
MNNKKIADSLDEGPLAFFIQGLILFYMVSLSLETVPSLQDYASMFKTIDTAVTAIFVVELIVRLIVTERPFKYLISFYGVIDVVAVLPALVGVDTKSLRALRLLRLFKLFKNKEINAAFTRLQLAFHEIKRDLIIFSFIAFIFIFFPAVGIYHFEKEAQPDKFSSIPAAFYWAIVSLTTVGYGDSYPITAGGEIFAGIVVLIGIGIVAIPTGLIASALTTIKNRKKDSEE